MNVITEQTRAGAKSVVVQLGSLKAGERVCIVSDAATQALGELMAQLAKEHGATPEHLVAPEVAIHGVEPPDDVAAAMRNSQLVIGIRTKSMAHTKARQAACQAGARYLSLPEYSVEMLSHPALRIDYPAAAARARRTADALIGAKRVRVVSAGGTDVSLNVEGRTPNFCPGYVNATNNLGSPPDIETNVSPVEEASEGIVVVDGSIAAPGFGRVPSPLTLKLTGGRIRSIEGPRDWVDKLEHLFSQYPENAKVLAEFGIGFNPEAKLCGNMLLDEGCYGAFHFGFGSNSTVGGKNVVGFHLDFMFFANRFFIDGKEFTV